MARMSFKWKTILPVTITLLIGVTIFIVVGGFLFSSYVTNSSNTDAQDAADRFAAKMDVDITDILTVVRTMGSIMEEQIVNRSADRNTWIDSCEGVLGDNHLIDGFTLYFEPDAFDGRDTEFASQSFHDSTGIFAPHIVKSGNNYSVTTISANDHQRSGLYQVVRDGRELITSPAVRGSVVTAQIAVPIKSGNRTIGFIAAEMNFADVQSMTVMQEFNLFPNAFVMVLSSDGTILGHSHAKMIGQNVFTTDSELTTGLKDAMRTGTTKERRAFDAAVNGVCNYIISPLTIISGQDPWLVTVAIPEKDSNGLVFSVLFTMVSVVVIVILLSIAILYYLINGSSKTLVQMNDELFSSAQSVLSSATQISGSGGVLAQGGVQQAASIEETSATASQAAVMIQQNADSAETVAALANEALEAANEGLARVEDLIISMRELESSSEEIAKIIAIIDNIAFQTNILALNASVEAARVGDAGKGFSVVAEEVRNLASRSTEAASNTSAIVEHNLVLSRQGVIGSSEVNRALKDISEKNKELNGLVAQINEASHEQLVGIEQITIALSQMEDVTQSNAAIAEENSASAVELEVQAQDLSKVQEELSTLVLGSQTSSAPKERTSPPQPQIGGRRVEREKPSARPQVRGQLPAPQTRRG